MKLEGLQRPEIQDIVAPLKLLTDRLAVPVRNGDYGLVIGDDYSGRIPYWAISGWIGQTYKTRGYPESSYLTIKPTPEGGLVQNLKCFRGQVGRALLVTEIMSHGYTVQMFGEALYELQIPFDVASVVSKYPKDHYVSTGYQVIYPPTRLYVGEDKRDWVPLYKKYKLLGLKWDETKESCEDDLSHEGRAELEKTMQDVNLLVDYLSQNT